MNIRGAQPLFTCTFLNKKAFGILGLQALYNAARAIRRSVINNK
jgi:hypothetical protein